VPQSFQEVRKSGAENERADEESDSAPEIAAIPAGCDPHADGIDAGEKEARQEAGRKENEQSLAAEIQARIRSRPE
jgi:hypothetical protein